MQRLESDPPMALFLVPPDFNPKDTSAARFWSVRGCEQAGNRSYGKGKIPHRELEIPGGTFWNTDMKPSSEILVA